jgi:hypothetical protein
VQDGTRFAFPLHHGHEEAASLLQLTRLSPKGRGLTSKLEGELLGSCPVACSSFVGELLHQELQSRGDALAPASGVRAV